VNAKVLGKLKHETAPCAPLEFAGLRSKMYSLLLCKYDDVERSKLTAKGIKKSFFKKHVRHCMYRETLTSKQTVLQNF
jgi:hypothetical protein